ncbi:ATP-binding protein [Cyanobium sp. FGCU-6]|nr:ATP-binding protein [Cyanobium sp. FGCU6]
MTVAAVDRLVHHCHTVGIQGDSYRQKPAAARVSGDSSHPPTSLTRASWPSRSGPAAVHLTRPPAATRKLAHPPGE